MKLRATIALSLLAAAAFFGCSSAAKNTRPTCQSDADCPGTSTCDVARSVCVGGPSTASAAHPSATTGAGSTTSGTGGAGGSACMGPNCTCNPPQVLCPKGCADLATDVKNCGSCENACPSSFGAHPTCAGSMCGLAPGGGGAGGGGVTCDMGAGCSKCFTAFRMFSMGMPPRVCCGKSAADFEAVLACICTGPCSQVCGMPGDLCTGGKPSTACQQCAEMPSSGCGNQLMACFQDM